MADGQPAGLSLPVLGLQCKQKRLLLVQPLPKRIKRMHGPACGWRGSWAGSGAIESGHGRGYHGHMASPEAICRLAVLYGGAMSSDTAPLGQRQPPPCRRNAAATSLLPASPEAHFYSDSDGI